MRDYRALISIPIRAESDDDAIRLAEERAASVHHPDGSVAGHVELVGETHPSSWRSIVSFSATRCSCHSCRPTGSRDRAPGVAEKCRLDEKRY
jgi:hypothetical protein